MYSTPVSSQKSRREGGQLGKLKSTRFILPSSVEKLKKPNLRLLKLADDSIMSPIKFKEPSSVDVVTPKMSKTPFRTPKSVARRPMISSDERILGTPDYLAPELLLKLKHGAAVDMWALGACLYEFMTGIPPFNDETPQKVFDNILNRNIEWPVDDEALSDEAMEAVESLLTMDQAMRPNAVEMQRLKFFAIINFENIRNVAPPFVPNLDNPYDTGYFKARNEMQDLKLSHFDYDE